MALPDQLQQIEMVPQGSETGKDRVQVAQEAMTPASEKIKRRPWFWIIMGGIALWVLFK